MHEHLFHYEVTMNAIQLDFNLKDENDVDVKLDLMQKQISLMDESMGKVRRSLFAKMGDLQKLYVELKLENEHLKKELNGIKNEKTEWLYSQSDSLFKVLDHPIYP